MFPYRPRVLMEQIMQRVTKTSAHRRHHILKLNRIGVKTAELHQHFLGFQRTPKGMSGKTDPEEMTQAVTEIIRDLRYLGRRQAELDLLQHRGPQRRWNMFRRNMVRFQYANAVYWSDMWNMLDWANFFFFIVVFAIRVWCDGAVNNALDSIADLAALDDPWCTPSLRAAPLRAMPIHSNRC